MRRIGLFGDIHGNLPALEVVLSELDGEVDELVCLGDVAAGPQPRETVARVRELACPVVQGNWDAWLVGAIPPWGDDVARKLADIGTWQAGRLSADERAFLEGLPPTHRLSAEGTTVLCFHGSPRSYDDWIFPSTPEEEVETFFTDGRAPLMAGGHTHVQMVRRLGRELIVNPGAVGLPFLDWWPKPVRVGPWAEYAILTVNGKRVSIELRRTTYDVDALLSVARASGMPHADWWAATWATELR
jgi:putative phosphoesterase